MATKVSKTVGLLRLCLENTLAAPLEVLGHWLISEFPTAKRDDIILLIKKVQGEVTTQLGNTIPMDTGFELDFTLENNELTFVLVDRKAEVKNGPSIAQPLMFPGDVYQRYEIQTNNVVHHAINAEGLPVQYVCLLSGVCVARKVL